MDVIRKISAAARNGFVRFPHGGVEVGGLLMGERRGEVLRITEISPIPIEYARGASFALTEAEELSVRTLLQKTPDVVGWYVSHTRTGLALSESDRAIYDQFFGESGQVCVVVEPSFAGVETWALHVRDANGAVTEVHEYQDVEAEVWAPLARSVSAMGTESIVRTPAPVVTFKAAPSPPPNNRTRTAAAAAAVILACGSGAWYLSSGGARKPAPAAAESGQRSRTAPAPEHPAEPAAVVSPVQQTQPEVQKKHVRRRHARARHRR